MIGKHLTSTSRPRISIALCIYNGARYLPEQLRSLAQQQQPPHELVLCDDGSADTSVSLAEEFARQAPFPVQVIRNLSNLGYSRNFAKAIGLCSGDVIALSDQDDIWYPQKLKRLSEMFLENSNIGGIFSNGDLIDTKSNKLKGDLWSSFSFNDADQNRLHSGQALEVLLQRNVVTGMAFAFRNAWKETLRDMPASWPHDAWLALMLAKENNLLACPEHLVAYRVHEEQQIGVPITFTEKRRYLQAHGLNGYLELSRKRNINEYQKYVRHFEDLVATYKGKTSAPDRKLMLQAQAKADHARNAAKLLTLNIFRRWPGVLNSSKSHRLYSATGIKAMLRDLFI